MSKPRIDIPKEKLAAFCRKWRIVELALFGSVLRDDFRPDSDVDVLVTFAPGAGTDINEFFEMKEELERLFGRPVDLLTRRSVEHHRNPLRKAEFSIRRALCMKLHDKQRLFDVLKAADLVATFADGFSFDRFKQDELVQSAVMRQIQIVGEACRMLSPEVRDSAPEVPWSRIIGMRHILVHGYNIVDLVLVWSVVETFLPQAQQLIERLLERHQIRRPI